MDWPAKYVTDGIAFACEIGNRPLLNRLLPYVRDKVQVQPSLNILALQANFHLYPVYRNHGFRAEDLLLSMSMTVSSDLDFFHVYLDDLYEEWPRFDIVIYKKLLSLTHRRNSMDGTRLIFSNILRQGSISTIFVGLCDSAARRSDIVILEVLANLGCQFHNKWTILTDAVRRGHPDVVEFIVTKNKDPLPDFADDSPIDIAFKFGSRRILDILLAAAPLANWGAIYPDEFPCHFSALLGISHEPLSDEKDACGRNVLHCACLSGNIELIEYIIQTGRYSVSSQDNTGMSLVHVATLLQRKDILELLLRQAPKPSLRLFTLLNEWSPLHFACNNGDYDMIEMLLEAGAGKFVKCPDRFECSPMDLACCKKGSLPIIKLLEQYGGDLKRPGKSLFSALNCNDMEIAEFLFPNISAFTDKVMGMTIVERACHLGNMEFLERFLPKFGNFWSEHRALVYACYAGNWRVAQYLIKTNRNCLSAPGPFGERPLEACLVNDHRCPNVMKTLDFLLMSGVKFHDSMLESLSYNLIRLYRENYYLFLKLCEFAQSQMQVPREFILQHIKGKNDHCYECLKYLDYDLPGEVLNVKSLLSLTRLVIRRSLVENGPIHELVRELPLPLDCQDYLVFRGRHELVML